MASVEKSHAQEAPKEHSSQLKNVGPAGFALYEYLGENRDHTGVWFHVNRNLRNYVVNNYNTLVEEIIDKGTLPIVPEVDLTKLMLSLPSEFKKASPTVFSIEEESEQEEETVTLGEDSSESTSKTTSRKPNPKKSKPKSSSSMMHTSEEANPLYRYEMIIFDGKVKEAGRVQCVLENLVKTQVEQFYRIMWLQCGQSMQHFLKNIKGWKKHHEARDAVWLFSALQAVGVGTVSVRDEEAASNTLKVFAGMQKSAHTGPHVYYDRWVQAYESSVACGNQRMSELQKIYMFNDSLDDATFGSFKESMKNDKLKNIPPPDSLEANFNIACNWSSKASSSGKPDHKPAVFYTAAQIKKYEARKAYEAAKNEAKNAKNAAASNDTKKPAKVPAHVTPAVKVDDQRKKTHKSRVTVESGLCFACHKPGHRKHECPELDNLDDDEGSEFLDSENDSEGSEFFDSENKSIESDDACLAESGLLREFHTEPKHQRWCFSHPCSSPQGI